MLTCAECGARAVDGADICPGCGARLSVVQPAGVGAGSAVSRATPGIARALDEESRRKVISRFFRDDTPVVAENARTGLPSTRRPASGVGGRGGAQATAASSASQVTAPAPPPIRVHRSVPGSGEWWDRRLHSSDVGMAPARRSVPPPPPRTAPPAPAAANGRIVITSADYSEGVSDAAAVPARGRDLFGVTGLRRKHVTGVAIAVVLVVAGVIVLQPTPTADDALPQRQTAAVSPEISPPAAEPAPTAPGLPGGAGEAPGTEAPDTGGELDGAARSIVPAEELLEAINLERGKRGRPDLVEDGDLTLVAETHVGEMIDGERLSHTPNKLLADRVTRWRLLAESIGVGPDVDALMNAFMRSDVDRRNLLDRKFRRIGVGAIFNGERLWVTLLFTDSGDPETTLSAVSG
jgi:uncharacterized protein YkwD